MAENYDAPGAEHEQPDILKELRSFESRANATVSELTAMQQELAELIPVQVSKAVTARFDGRGFLVALDIDDEARRPMDAAELVADINIAIATAERPNSSVASSGAFGTDTQDAASGVNDILSQLLGSLTSGFSMEPTVTQNDLKSVSVTTQWGEIFTIDCNVGWVRAASSQSITDEILRVADAAVRADDPFQRRVQKEQS